jgi:hypothetical protein
MDSLLSFPVGLFHPLQHAGLSRRSPICRPSGSYLVNRLESGAKRVTSTDSAFFVRLDCFRMFLVLWHSIRRSS